MSNLPKPTAQEAEQERILTLQSLGRRHGLPPAMVNSAISERATVEAFGRAVLEHLEARQNASGNVGAKNFSVDMSAKDRAKYSVVNAVRSALTGENSLEREISVDARRSFDGRHDHGRARSSITIPYDLLGERAVMVTTGSGQHVVPQVQGQFQGFLTSRLGLARAGMTVLNGLRGDLDLPAGDVLGTAGTPGENASQSDSEATFKNARLSARPIRSRATFSRTLLNNSTPQVDAIIQQVLQDRTALKLEQQIMFGAGGSAEIAGIDGLAGVNDADFANDEVSYAAFYELLSSIDDSLGLVGDPAILTTMRVCAKGMTTSRFGGDGFLGVLNKATGSALDEFNLDGIPVFRSHAVKRNYQSPDSPSDFVAHGAYAGVWSATYLGTFGPGLEIVVDPYGEAENGLVIMWSYLDCDWKAPHPQVLARANNILV